MARTDRTIPDERTRREDALIPLLSQAESGDKSALSELKEMLAGKDDLWDAIGDLATSVEAAMVQAICGTDLVFAEGVHHRIESMKDELAAPEAPPLERLLVSRIVVCWLQVHHADMACAEDLGSVEFDVGDYKQRRQDRAHKRLLSAIKALATVRKLALPLLQLNVGDNQVNIAQGGCSTEAHVAPDSGPSSPDEEQS